MGKLIDLADNAIGMEYVPDNYWIMPNLLIGIEVEVENIQRLDDIRRERDFRLFWDTHDDGSLRNGGVEFVCKPVMGKDLTKAIEVFNKTFDMYAPEAIFSLRTSVHVHADVRMLDSTQLVPVVYFYTLLERNIFSMFGNRECNQYCVPLYESDDSRRQIAAILSTLDTSYTKGAIGRINRYHALNIQAINKYGTLEFRHCYGTRDKQLWHNWINIIMGVIKAQNYTWKYILEMSKGISSIEILINEIYGSYAPLLLGLPNSRSNLKLGTFDLRELHNNTCLNDFSIKNVVDRKDSLYEKMRTKPAKPIKKKVEEHNEDGAEIPPPDEVEPPRAPHALRLAVDDMLRRELEIRARIGQPVPQEIPRPIPGVRPARAPLEERPAPRRRINPNRNNEGGR